MASVIRVSSGRVLFGFNGTQTLPLASTANKATMCSTLLLAQIPMPAKKRAAQ